MEDAKLFVSDDKPYPMVALDYIGKAVQNWRKDKNVTMMVENQLRLAALLFNVFLSLPFSLFLSSLEFRLAPKSSLAAGQSPAASSRHNPPC